MKSLRPAILALAVFVFLQAGLAQKKYSGPRPPKPDVPFLLHADNLVPTEVLEANEEKRKNETIASIQGASSPARTPLAEPIFLLESVKVDPGQLELWKLESKDGRRQLVLPDKPKKSGPRPLRLMVTRLDGSLYRVEVNEELENGEYSLSPRGSSQVFCFQVY
ncbi:MAG: hypothetical protein LLG20_21975 [Acidobacteriales bacterium]|nr:hypothetical protein [Terriglobales bacterium]